MAVPIIFLVIIFLLLLPSHSLTGPNPVSCGGIDIKDPFSTNARATYPIQCNGSAPTVQFGGVTYPVMNISYQEKVITIYDQVLSHYLADSNCSFLYNFIVPVHHFNPSSDNLGHLAHKTNLSSDSSGSPTLRSPKSLNCVLEDFLFLTGFFYLSYNFSACGNYNIYFETKNELLTAIPPSCSVSQSSSFEWVLSFSEYDGSFSLLSAGFSRKTKLHTDCFNCQVKRNCRGNGDGRDSFCKCEHEPVCLGSKRNSRKNLGTIIGVSAGAIFVIACLLVLFMFKRRRRLQRAGLSDLSRSMSLKISSKKDPELAENNYNTHIFTYDELEEATNCFNASRELGDGGFGTVYKGKLRDGRTVAVKRLYENNFRRLEQFMNEVEILSRLRHQNLVTLYGCTSRHSRELLLVYEYIPNGTLADHLHGSLATEGALPWSVRMSIAIETADALAYLHAIQPQIIHRDVKTNNILLDDNFHVKVADFGLSRLFPLDATHVSTAPQGTPGYVDPEYHQCYQLTDKSDVYSFGVVLVELISSKPAVDISRHRHEINLANMAITKIQNCQIDQLVDTELGYYSDVEIKRMINQVAELAFRCLQSDGEMRPCIREALEVLREIKGSGSKAVEVELSKAQTKEETRLLKNVPPFSPDSVTVRWSSRSTTPNTSGN